MRYNPASGAANAVANLDTVARIRVAIMLPMSVIPIDTISLELGGADPLGDDDEDRDNPLPSLPLSLSWFVGVMVTVKGSRDKKDFVYKLVGLEQDSNGTYKIGVFDTARGCFKA
jgi:hypothetical protein